MTRASIVMTLCLVVILCFNVHSQSLLSSPTCVVYDQVRNCYYVTNQSSGTNGGIVKIDSNGVQSWFYQGLGVCTGSLICGDTLIVAYNTSPSSVAFLDLKTGSLMTTVQIPPSIRLYSIAADGTGYLYLSDYESGSVYKLKLGTWEISVYISGVYRPCGLFWQSSHNRLLMISGAEISIISAVNPVDSTLIQLVGVGGWDFDRMAEDCEGNLYVSDWTLDVIYKFDPDFVNPYVIILRNLVNPSGIAINNKRKIMAIPNTTANSVAFRDLPLGAFNRVWTGPAADGGSLSDAQGVSWIDYNNDKYDDLIITNSGTLSGLNNSQYRNNKNGLFSKILSGILVTDGGVSEGSTWADFDNNGTNDCFVVNAQNQTNYLYTNNGVGVFTKVATGKIVTDTGNSFDASWADYDKDGLLDLIVSRSGNNAFYHNIGNSFEKKLVGEIATDTGQAMGLAWGDYDNDLDYDLFMSMGGGSLSDLNDRLYHNSGGTFTKITDQPVNFDGVVTYGGSWGDYDNDGDLDLFVPAGTDGSNGNDFLYRNDGDGTFTAITDNIVTTSGGNSVSSCWVDVNNDGCLDLLVANSFTGTGEVGNFIFMNNCDGTFNRVTTDQIGQDTAYSSSVACTDFDNDGDQDILFTQSGGRNNLFYKNNLTTGGWIEVKCVGTRTNRSAIGVKVRVKATIGGNSIWQMREISTRSGFRGQSSLIAHFGLGNATVIDSIICEWPRGCVDILTNVAIKQILTITETVTQDCCCEGITGNVDELGIVDITDLSLLVSYLTGVTTSLPCMNEANVDGIGDIDIYDLSVLVDFLMGEGATLQNCP